MTLLPLPLMIAEFLIFYFAVKEWGFFNSLGLYLLPSFLGLLIVSTVGRVAVMSMQTTVMRGQMPANQMLNTAAVFLSGLLLLIPSFFTRVLGAILLLPGLRHLAIWRFKIFMAKKISQGFSGFQNAQGPFGFSGGSGGFRFYRYGSRGFRQPGDFEQSEFDVEVDGERDVSPKVLDVTPLKVVHEEKKDRPDEQ